METKIFKEEDDLQEAGELIRRGGLVAFPTETVYGLGASAFDDAAAKKIYEAKGRPSDNPLIVHVADFEQIDEVARDISEDARKLINRFMPGPITLILKKKPCVSEGVTAGLDTVGVRFPSNKTAQKFIKAAGVPIAAPSANISGKPSPTAAQHVIDDMSGRIDAVIDGGRCDVGVESTIVDTTGEVCTVLRPGGVTFGMLSEVIPNIRLDKNITSAVGADEKPKCPGTKYKHYSPDASVTVIEGERSGVVSRIKELIAQNRDKTIGVLFMYDAVYDDAIMLKAGESCEEYAHNLFNALREFDRLGADIVYAEFTETDDFAPAVKNRLYKAAAYKVEHI